MITDLHNHFIPVAAIQESVDSPVSVTWRGDGQLGVNALGHDFVVPAAIADLEAQWSAAVRERIQRRALMIPPFVALYELEPRTAVGWARRLNEGIAEAVRSRPDQFLGFATVPLQDGDAAARELDHAVSALGHRGVQILTSVCGRGLDSPELRQFWAAAAEYEVPVFIHPHYIGGAERMGQQHLRNLIGNPSETALAGARLLFSGILQEYPRLKVILAHGGGSLPALIGRLARGYQVRPEFRGSDAEPYDGLRRLYYDTVVFDPVVLRSLVEIVGRDRLVLGSDFPFDMAEDHPVGFLEGCGLDEGVVESILHASDRLLARGPTP